MEVSLAADATLVPRLGKQPLGEVESLLRFRKLLLEDLNTVLKFLQPLGDLGRRQLRSYSEEMGDLHGGDSNDRYDWYENCNDPGVHVAFLAPAEGVPAPPNAMGLSCGPAPWTRWPCS